MKIAFLVWADRNTGLGHYFRCQALAEAAFNRGHRVRFISNRKSTLNGSTFQCEYLDKTSFEFFMENNLPDWIVIDIPDQIPDWLWAVKARKCVIDGIGHEAKAKADLNISQGFDGGEYGAPDYLLLRQHMMLNSAIPKPREGMFVFGGGADKLGLARRFAQSCKDIPANIVISPMVDWVEMPLSPAHTLYTLDDNRVFSVMKASTSAAVHHGMIVWELCRDGIAPKVFSYSLQHLEDAKRMEEMGYILAYDAVGLPEGDIPLLDFLQRPVVFMGKPIDGHGAERTIKLMERT